jgi:hypothetical protein
VEAAAEEEAAATASALVAAYVLAEELRLPLALRRSLWAGVSSASSPQRRTETVMTHTEARATPSIASHGGPKPAAAAAPPPEAARALGIVNDPPGSTGSTG